MGSLSVAQILAEIWKIVQDNMSAIGLLLFNYEEYKVVKANREKADALLALALKENQSAVDQKYAGKSDDDVIDSKFGDGSNGDGGDSGGNTGQAH
jgi:hypothetical protein